MMLCLMACNPCSRRTAPSSPATSNRFVRRPARMRHRSGKTTPETCGHMWPGKDETTRAAIGGVIAARVASSSKDPAGALRAEPS